MSSGGTPSRQTPTYWGGSIPWVTTSQVDFGVIAAADEHITELGLRSSAAKLFEPGTILLAMYGQGKTRGKVAVLGIHAATNQACAAIEFRDSVCPEFVFQFLIASYDVLRGISNTGNQENLSGAIVKSVRFPVPPLREQRAIAEALSDADALIAALDALIAKKRDIKQATMQQLLTGKTRLPGFSREWKTLAIGDVAEVLNGLTYNPYDVSEGGTIVLRASNIQLGQLNFADTVHVSVDVPEKHRVREKDILICVRNGSRDLIGKCALIDARTSGEAFGAFMAVLRSGSSDYLFQHFQSDAMKRQIHEHLGATINQITNTSLKGFQIGMPADPSESLAISNVLSDMDSELVALEARRDKARAIKQGMMQELLTGRIRLV